MHLKRETKAASNQKGDAVTYQTPAFCSFEVVPNHKMRNPELALAATAAVGIACMQVMADDADEM
jgi:hypothetical protein